MAADSAPLRPYQAAAATDIAALYDHGHTRVTCVMPCGTGKTRLAAHVIGTTGRVVVFVPTIVLLAQTVTALTNTRPGTVIAVCQASRIDVDDITPAEVSGTVTTDPDTLAAALTGARGPVTVVSTYASSPVVAEATATAGITWDLLVADEAHRTAGTADKTWSTVLHDALLPAARRLFLTATPRAITADPRMVDPTGDPIPVATMTDAALYGPRVEPLTLRDAITQGWLSDYRIAIVGVTHRDVAAITDTLVTSNGEPVDPNVAARQVALLRRCSTHPINSLLVFHNRVDASADWSSTWAAVAADTTTPQITTTCTHIDGTMTPEVRYRALAGLAAPPAGEVAVVSNCRVLAEGVNVPALDAVVFAEPRTSAPDIVQIVGRSLRVHPKHPTRKALIVIPVVVADTDTARVEDRVSETDFATIWQVLTTLAHEDTALYRSLAHMRSQADKPHPGPDEDPDHDPMVEFDFGPLTPDFTDAFRLRVLNRTTSPWAVFAVRMRDYLSARDTHTVYPRPGYVTPDGYPLGERAARARTQHATGAMHPRVAEHIANTVPGWSWQPKPTGPTKRSFTEWIDLLNRWVAATGTRRVWQKATIDTPTGPAPIGAWVDRMNSTWARLTPQQQDALTTVLGPRPWHNTPARPLRGSARCSSNSTAE